MYSEKEAAHTIIVIAIQYTIDLTFRPIPY